MERDFFADIRTKSLRPADFWLETRTPTALKFRLCSLLLAFDNTSREAEELVDMWRELSTDVAGVNFLTLDANREPEIMQAFTATASDENNPLTDFAIKKLPTVLVYRDGWPQAYYNDSLNYEAVKDFALNFACSRSCKNRTQYEGEDKGILSERELYTP